ncbi:MAG: DUF2339 domain-containing protein, partial [Alphaproteobacteria bacterium]|nr:DUF2339 domain-containing protein [Alphaproteobacteria bacterium]
MLNALFLTGALVVIGIPVSLVYLLIVTARLRQRIAALEAGLTLPQVPSGSERQDVMVSDAVPDTRPPIDPVMRRKPPPLPRSTIAPAEQHSGPPKAIVLTALNLWRMSQWIAANWFYAVSATSLALAGVFLVIYGAEQGLMPPSVRILTSLLLGCGLIGAGEYIRRRFGDDAGVSTAYLPSTLSGAGIVTLFGAILAARHLYGFIGPGVTLTGMAVVGLVAMVLGWFSGPLLAAVGILGAMAAPFVIGGSSDDPSLLLAYFAIVTIAGLGIDTVRRWGGVSILSLVTGFGAGYLLTALSGLVVVPFFMMFCGIMALAAIAIPVRSLTPDHQGTSISIAMLARHARDAWPEFPTRLAGGAVVAASVLITLSATDVMRNDLLRVAILVLSGLTLALLLWTRNAPALVDLAAAPAAALLVVVGSGNRPWGGGVEVAEASVAPAPLFYTLIMGLGLVLTLAEI